MVKCVKTVYLSKRPTRFCPYIWTVDEDGKCWGYSAGNEGIINRSFSSEPKENSNIAKKELKVGTIILFGETQCIGDINERRKRFIDYH